MCRLVIAATTISIHALRKESDPGVEACLGAWDISIHALRKESDLGYESHYDTPEEFQSTLSVRRATRGAASVLSVSRDFNPRSP